MQTKLHINIIQGVIDAEGDQAFVSRVYEDFKEILMSQKLGKAPNAPESAQPVVNDVPSSEGARSNPTKRTRKRVIRNGGDQGNGKAEKVSSYAPTLDNSLDTRELASFYEVYSPKNHAERVLIFTKFLDEKLGINPCTADQIYTCYRTLRERIPEVFIQSIRDASGNRYGYIEYNSPTNITATVRGTNHFEQGGIKLKEVK